jgi:hypothetical protein
MSKAPGAPGHASYIIFQGVNFFIEIYEQTPRLERSFTKEAYSEICKELKEVLKSLDDVKNKGILINKEYYPVKPKNSQTIIVKEDSKGIYEIEAWVKTTNKGDLYLKVYRVKSSERLSKDRVTERSKRLSGWSTKGDELFPYFSQITIYEGDWSKTYEARFELWHRQRDGSEKKLAETTRNIFGWQR